MTQRQPRGRQPAIANGHHDTVVRIAAPKSESGYQRFFYLLVAAVLAALALGIAAWVRDRDAAIVIRTKVEQHDDDIAGLKSQSTSFAATVADLRTVTRDLSELRQQLTASVSDRYTGSQASADRAAITDRLARLEAAYDDFATWRASTTEWMRSRGGPQSSAKSSTLFGAAIP